MRLSNGLRGVLCAAIFYLCLQPSEGFCKKVNGDPVFRFVRSVIANPQNDPDITEVIGFLEDQSSGLTYNNIQFARTQDLLEYLTFLNSRTQFFQKNNALLISFLTSIDEAPTHISGKIDRLVIDEKQILHALDPTDIYQPDVVTNFSAMYQMLKRMESFMVVRVKKLQVINDELRSLKIEILAYRRSDRRRAVSQEDEAQLTALRDHLQKKDLVIAQQSRSISELKNQFEKMQLGLDVFRDRLQETSRKVDELVQEVASRSLDLYAKERETANAKQRMDEVAAELGETKERLRLVQRIIQEKDDHIQALEEDMLNMQSQVNQAPIENQAILALQQELKAVSVQLEKNIAESRQKIAHLEERFQEVVLAKTQLETDLMQSHLTLAFLEKQNQHKESMISDLEKSSYLRSQKINQIKDVLKIYQLKLKDYKGMLQQKELEIQTYRQRLGKMEIDDFRLRKPCVAGVSDRDVCFLDHNFENLLWSEEGILQQSQEAIKILPSYRERK